MHPNSEEVLRGVAGALVTHVLPELQSPYARAQLMFSVSMLGVVANSVDGAAQQLAGDNTSLRALALRAADALPDDAGGATLRDELRAVGAEVDASLSLSDLSAASGRVRGALGRLGVFLEGAHAPALRSLREDVIDALRAETAGRALSLLGPRAHG